jgi:hypothetical protein
MAAGKFLAGLHLSGGPPETFLVHALKFPHLFPTLVSWNWVGTLDLTIAHLMSYKSFLSMALRCSKHPLWHSVSLMKGAYMCAVRPSL